MKPLVMPRRRRLSWHDVLAAVVCTCGRPKKPYRSFCPFHLEMLRRTRWLLYWHCESAKHNWLVAYWQVGCRHIREVEQSSNLRPMIDSRAS